MEVYKIYYNPKTTTTIIRMLQIYSFMHIFVISKQTKKLISLIFIIHSFKTLVL